MKCLVTGSSGFIGSHLVKELRKRGHEVYEMDPKSNGDDIRNVNTEVIGALQIDWVFHLGAASGSLHFQPNPIEGTDVNCVGTVKLLEAARQAGVKKFVFASTGSNYGGTPIPHHESWAQQPPNFYGATKLFDELACKFYSELYGLNTVIFRFASVYGDNEDSKILPNGNLANVISQFIWSMLKGEQPEIWGTGKQTRDFIFVDDIVNGLIFGAENLGNGQVYNLGTGAETSFNQVIEKINLVLGTDIKPKYVEPSNKAVQKNYVDKQLFDVDKLAQQGYRTSINVENGVRRIVENIRSRG